MLTHFAVFSPASQILFFAGASAAEATKEHPKPTTGRIFIWQDAQSAFPYYEPPGTMPCKAETAELAQRDSDSDVLLGRFCMRNYGFRGIGHNESLTIFLWNSKRMRRHG